MLTAPTRVYISLTGVLLPFFPSFFPPLSPFLSLSLFLLLKGIHGYSGCVSHNAARESKRPARSRPTPSSSRPVEREEKQYKERSGSDLPGLEAREFLGVCGILNSWLCFSVFVFFFCFLLLRFCYRSVAHTSPPPPTATTPTPFSTLRREQRV